MKKKVVLIISILILIIVAIYAVSPWNRALLSPKNNAEAKIIVKNDLSSFDDVGRAPADLSKRAYSEAKDFSNAITREVSP